MGRAHRSHPGREPSLLPAVRVPRTPFARAFSGGVRTVAPGESRLAARHQHTTWRAPSPPQPGDQPGAARLAGSPRSIPACPGEPGRAEPGLSEGRWCPLLSRKYIGAAEIMSGTCHPGRGTRHPPLRAASAGSGLRLAARRGQHGLALGSGAIGTHVG